MFQFFSRQWEQFLDEKTLPLDRVWMIMIPIAILVGLALILWIMKRFGSNIPQTIGDASVAIQKMALAVFVIIAATCATVVVVGLTVRFAKPFEQAQQTAQEFAKLRKELEDLKKQDRESILNEELDRGNPKAHSVRIARDKHRDAEFLKEGVDTNLETVESLKRTVLKYGFKTDYSLCFTKEGTAPYDDDANQGDEIPEFTEIRLYPMFKKQFFGFSETLLLGTSLERGREQWGWFRPSALSDFSLEEYVKKLGHTGEWISIPISDPRVLFQKAVTLFPGETSNTLVYLVETIGSYRFYSDGQSEFSILINGQPIALGQGNQRLPPIKGPTQIKVSLSPHVKGARTVRFVYTKEV